MSKAFLGLYIHVPFCTRKCDYCSFYSKIPAQGDFELYLAHLKQEFKTRLSDELSSRVRTIYVGGGNPTTLGHDNMRQFIQIISQSSANSEILEWTFESNPETFDFEMSKILRDVPNLRLSLGIQRLNNDELAALGRATSVLQCEMALELAFQATSSVNVDIILGIPFVRSIRNDLATFLGRYAISHISTYFLSAEEGTPYFEKIRNGQKESPENIGPEELFEVKDFLFSNEFEHYEISNFAKPGHKCLHNLNYWKCGDYLGFGPAAVSTIENQRVVNPSSFSCWLNGGGAVSEPLSIQVRRREWLMLSLRLLTEGLNVRTFESNFGPISTAQTEILDSHVKSGNLLCEGSAYRLTRQGIPFANNIISDLF